MFRLYDENYLGHLIAINDESRLFIYKINQGTKTVTEEAFCVLGPVRESYGVSIIDNLIVVSYLQVNLDSQVEIFYLFVKLLSKRFFAVFLTCMIFLTLSRDQNFKAQVSTIFDLKGVPTEHGPSISGSSQSHD